ncbi:hypothetical protein CLV89_104169 [Tritonibacter scottomollicae]|uniref:Uncharacterized protein n=2 Tax=Tritonibacter scottomollicae TaxID=483013 RepID=A0A2T1AIC2_TRISK|nr:hypothetical protein CLV89_104169 [Tritonibacter scottomollicae]
MLQEIRERLQGEREEILLFPVHGFPFTLEEYGETNLTADSYSINEMSFDFSLAPNLGISVRFSRLNQTNTRDHSPLFDQVTVIFSSERNAWKKKPEIVADVLRIISSRGTPAAHVDTGEGPSVLRELILSNSATHREIMASLNKSVEDMMAKRAELEEEASTAEKIRETAHTEALEALEAERKKLLLQSHMSERRNITTSIKDLMQSNALKREGRRSLFFATAVFLAYMSIGAFGAMSSYLSFSSMNDTGPSPAESALMSKVIERLSSNANQGEVRFDENTGGAATPDITQTTSGDLESSAQAVETSISPAKDGSIALEWFMIIKLVLSTVVALVGFSAAVAWMKRYYDEEMRMSREMIAFAADIERASWVIEAIHEVKHEAKGELPSEWIEAVTRNLFSGGAQKAQEDESTRALRALMGLAGAAKVGPNGLELDIGKKGARSMAEGG